MRYYLNEIGRLLLDELLEAFCFLFVCTGDDFRARSRRDDAHSTMAVG